MCDFSFRKEWDELLIVGRSVQQIDNYTDVVSRSPFPSVLFYL
jgi:hypothetical protein